MRLRAAWAIPWLLAVFLSALSTQGSSAQEDNLLINGGFEDGTAGWWTSADTELTVDDTLVQSGSFAGLFDTDGASRHEVKHCLPVAPSAEYEFRGFVARRNEDLSSWLHLRVEWRDGANCPLDEPALAYYDSPEIALEEAERWYELQLTLRSPSTARSALIMVEVQESEATVYLDDFAVSGPAAPAETPTPEPSASPSPSPTHTAGPHGTPAPTATAHQRTPVPAATPTASPDSLEPADDARSGGALRNGSFEEADSEGRPSSWRKYGGELFRTSAARFEGQFAAALRSETSSTKWIYQTVTVEGGKAYILSGYALKDDPAVAAAYLRLSWYASPDGSGQAIDSADSTEHLTDDSPEFRLLTTGAVVAPAEAASAKARLMLDPVGEAPGSAYFDAVTFEETTLPEPTLSPTAAPPLDDDGEAVAPSCPAAGESKSTPAPTSRPRNVPTPAGSSTRPRSSPTAAGNSTPAVLGATLAPSAAATTVAPTSTRTPATVYRERKSNLSVRYGATAREESGGGGLWPPLLALAAGVPALIGAGIGVSYWRWRRARLR